MLLDLHSREERKIDVGKQPPTVRCGGGTMWHAIEEEVQMEYVTQMSMVAGSVHVWLLVTYPERLVGE